MDLKLQLFAEDTITYDEQVLNEAQQEINSIAEGVSDSINTIAEQINEVGETSTDAETQTELQDVNTEIEKDKNKFAEAFAGLSSVISSALELFSQNKQQFSSEIKSWVETFKTSMSGLKQAYTAEGATQGMETVKTSVNNIVDSGIKISGYTRGIVTETVNIIKNSGSLIKGVTGNSPQQLVQKGVGTIKTLLTQATSNPGGTIISQLVGKLGSSFSSWITGKAA